MISEVSTGLTVVAATLLGEQPFQFETVFRDSQEGAVTFLSPHQIVIGAPVKLESNDRLWMGTVRSSQRENGSWWTTLDVEHSLANLAELSKLASRFR